MNVNDVIGLRQQEQGNAWLMKMLAERDLETEVMKEVAIKISGAPPNAGKWFFAATRSSATPSVCTIFRLPFDAWRCYTP